MKELNKNYNAADTKVFIDELETREELFCYKFNKRKGTCGIYF